MLKSQGPGKLHTRIMKELANQIASLVARILNTVEHVWRIANVVPICKK